LRLATPPSFFVGCRSGVFEVPRPPRTRLRAEVRLTTHRISIFARSPAVLCGTTRHLESTPREARGRPTCLLTVGTVLALLDALLLFIHFLGLAGVPLQEFFDRCTHRLRDQGGDRRWPRLVKTAFSGSFGFQGPGSHLIGLDQQFRLSIGSCGGRQWGWKRTHLLLPRPQFFLREWMWANQRMTPAELARRP